MCREKEIDIERRREGGRVGIQRKKKMTRKRGAKREDTNPPREEEIRRGRRDRQFKKCGKVDDVLSKIDNVSDFLSS